MTTFPNNLSQGNKRNGKLEPFWRTQPVRNREQEQFLNEFYRSEGKTRGGIEEQAKAILARPGALSSTGMIDPRVVSKEEARTIARYRATQPQEETPIQRARPRKWWEPAVHTADAFYKEISLPFAGSVAAVASPSVREAYNEARAEGKPISVAFREGWEKGLVRTPSTTVSLPGKGISFGDKSIDDIQLGLKGAGEIILDPLNLLPGIGFGRQIGTGVRAAAGAAKGATAKGMALGLKGLDVASPARAAYAAGPIPPDKIVVGQKLQMTKGRGEVEVIEIKEAPGKKPDTDKIIVRNQAGNTEEYSRKALMKQIEPPDPDVIPGAPARTATGPWVYHKTNLESIQGIQQSGFNQGDFIEGLASFRKTDFPGNVSLRVRSGNLPPGQVGEYGKGVKWHLPAFADTGLSIAPENIEIFVDAAGKPVRLQGKGTWKPLSEVTPAPTVGAGGRSVDETLEELNRLNAEAFEAQRLADEAMRASGKVMLGEFDPILAEGFRGIPESWKVVRGTEKLSDDELFVWNKYKEQLADPTGFNESQRIRKRQIDVVEEAQAAARQQDVAPVVREPKWAMTKAEFEQAAKRGKLIEATGKMTPEEENYLEIMEIEGVDPTAFGQGRAAGYSPDDIAHFYVKRRYPGWRPWETEPPTVPGDYDPIDVAWREYLDDAGRDGVTDAWELLRTPVRETAEEAVPVPTPGAALVDPPRIPGTRNSEEWAKLYKDEYGIEIIDTDGWPREKAAFNKAWKQKITQRGFEKRLSKSTQQRRQVPTDEPKVPTDDVPITADEGVPPGGIIPEGVGVGDEAPRPRPLSREDVQKWVQYLEEQKWAQGNTEAIMLRAQQLARAEALEAVQEAPGRVRQAKQVVRSIQDQEDLKVLLATREEQHLLRQQAALDLRKKQIKTAKEQRELAVQQREVRERLEAGQKKMALEVTRRDPRTGKIVEGRAARIVRQEQIRKEAARQQAAREASQQPDPKPRDALALVEAAIQPEPKGSLLSRIIGINLREKIYDRNFAISQIGRAVGIRGFIEGKGTALAAKAHKLAQIVPGSLGAAEDIIRRVYAPVMNRVGRKDWKILEQYMILRRSADLKLRKVDTRYPFQEMDVPGGLSGAEVQTALNALENAPGMTPERWAVITQGAEDLWRLNREQILQPMRDEGIISAEAYQNIIRDNQHYIPFKRDRFTQWVERSYVTPEANLSTTGLKAMTPTGSEAKLAANPLLHMVNDPVKVQGMIFRNRAARSIVEALEELQEQTGEVLARREGEKTLVDGREHIFKPEITNEEDIISFFDDGVLQRVQVPKIYAEVAKGLSSEPDNILLSIARKINAPIRYGATTYNPFFLPVNILRDAMSAAFREKLIPFGPDYIKGLWSVIRRSADFEEAARSGALLSGVVEDMSKGRGVRSPLGGLSVPSNPWEAATFPFRLMEELNIIFERGVRVGTFRKLRGEGIDALDAAVRSRDATVDFAKAGNVGRVINQVIPFSNAGIQGFANMTRTIWQNPQRVAAFGSIFSSAAISARLWNTQFDTHELIPDYEYTRNYVVMLGEGIRKDETKFPIYIKIPKGEIAAMLTFPAEAFMHLARKEDDRSIAETYLDTGLEALRASTPVGEIPLLSEEGIPMPPIVQTAVGYKTNVQMFTGAPIVPMGEEQKPPEQQVGPKTSTTATAIGQQFKISPRKLDYALRDIAGGTGQSALWMMDTALKAVGIDPEAPGALAADAELKPEGVEEVAQTPLRRFIGTRDTQIERMGYEAFDKAVIDTNRKLSTLPGPDIYGVSLGKVSSELMGGRIELTPNQRATYQRILGVYAYENVKKIITSSSYRGKPADVKERYLKQMVSNARERARNKIISIVMREQKEEPKETPREALWGRINPATAGVR